MKAGSLFLGLAIILLLGQDSSAFNIRSSAKSHKSSGRNINGNNVQTPNSAVPLRSDPTEVLEHDMDSHGEGDFDPEHDGEEYWDGDEEPDAIVSSTPSTTPATTIKPSTTTLKLYPSKTKPTKKASTKPKKSNLSVSISNAPSMTKPVRRSGQSPPAISPSVKSKIPELQKEPVGIPSKEGPTEADSQHVGISSTSLSTNVRQDINKLNLGDAEKQAGKDDVTDQVKKPDQISKRMGEEEEDFEFDMASEEEPEDSSSSSNSNPIVVPSGRPWNNDDVANNQNQTSNEAPQRTDTTLTSAILNGGAQGTGNTNQQDKNNNLPWSSLYGPPPFANQLANLHSAASVSGGPNKVNDANTNPKRMLPVPSFLQQQYGNSYPNHPSQQRYNHNAYNPWEKPSHLDSEALRRNHPNRPFYGPDNKNLYGANIHLDGATLNSQGKNPTEDSDMEDRNDRKSVQFSGMRIEFPEGAPSQANNRNFFNKPKPTPQNFWNMDNGRSDFDDYNDFDSYENGFNKGVDFKPWRRNGNSQQIPSPGPNYFQNMNYQNRNRPVNTENNWNAFGSGTPNIGNNNDFWMQMMNAYQNSQNYGMTSFQQNPMTNQFFKRSGSGTSDPWEWQLRRAAMMNMFYNYMMNPYYAMMMGGAGMNPMAWNYFQSMMQNQPQRPRDFMRKLDTENPPDEPKEEAEQQKLTNQ